MGVSGGSDGGVCDVMGVGGGRSMGGGSKSICTPVSLLHVPGSWYACICEAKYNVLYLVSFPD
jgi:hypothetical protein